MENIIIEVCIGVLTFFLGIIVQRYLTRYNSKINIIHNELTEILKLCEQACVNANNGEPCLYVKKQMEHGFQYEPSDTLYIKVKYSTIVKDKRLLTILKDFLVIVDEYSNLFTLGGGRSLISSTRTVGGITYNIWGNRNETILEYNEEERIKRLHDCSAQLNIVYDKIKNRIWRLIGH